ncbi:hypothetical protein KW432_20945 [Vibrio fluvialis]|nr:hypothetical protein [Vibrio fluvialis]
MTPSEKERFDDLYQQHLTQLKLQGKRAKTISAYLICTSKTGHLAKRHIAVQS